MACVAVPPDETRILSTLQLQPGRLTFVDEHQRLYHQPETMDAATFFTQLPQEKQQSQNATYTVHAGGLRWVDETMLSPAQERQALWLAIHPTCGHCQRVLPLYRNLGRLLQALDYSNSLPLYVVDVTKIDQGVNVEWVPTLVYDGRERVVLEQQGFVHEHDLLEWVVQFMERKQVQKLYDQMEQMNDK